MFHFISDYEQRRQLSPEKPIRLEHFPYRRVADMASVLPDAADADSPLKADELQVLRAQYEKEGYYVGVQTKFNYAWVRTPPSLSRVPC